MPYQPIPRFNSSPDKMLEMPQPGVGGLNLTDLEYEQSVGQSPYMLNMMYRNMAFSKRYGIGLHKQYNETVYAIETFDGDIIAHVGTDLYKGDSIIASGLPEETGLFIKYRQSLYYISDKIYGYTYTNGVYTWGEVEPYVPTVLLNRKPDGSYEGDVVEDFNIIGLAFNQQFHGDGSSTVFHLWGDEADTTRTPIVTVDGTVVSATYNANNKTVTLATAPQEGTNNVEVTWYLKDTALKEDRDRIMASKYYASFGGNNNSRLFLAGGGESKYYYSEAYNATYFPENNFAVLGNSEDDITGFGLQYNVLIVFKPKEMYSLTYYIQSSSTTLIEEDYGMEAFRTQLVNPRVGCDAPYTIQLINNQLTWFNSVEGVCTLVSTNILDERNVRPISRNINRTNNMGVKGILDFNEDLSTIQSVDYDNRYFLVFPESGFCYAWDYNVSSYNINYKGEADPAKVAWFIFDNFHVKQFLKVDKALVFSSLNFSDCLLKLNDSFSDFDGFENGEEKTKGIRSYYMTPFMQFSAVEYLKNVTNIYVQCRGDTASVIDMYYYTDESERAEPEPDSIRIGGKLWKHFEWSTFQWLTISWASTFRRKCSLKKIQMASFYFENDEDGRDMSITHIGIQYKIVKYIK